MKYLFNFAALMLAVVSMARAVDISNSTLHNWQTAYDGESNARAKYLEFAKKAEQEAYGRVASLFRAAAAAEHIHRTCEASVIKEMGATPQAKIALPDIRSTKQNLEDSASKGEAYERDTMYPQFIKQARKDGNHRAAQCLTYAQAAEAEHFNLFNAAARELAQMKGGPATYYVCTEGGYTMARLDVSKSPGGKYLKVK
jgi:rubrerythrin